ncbi:MAG: secretion protein HlyD [Rhodothalassiaceae bacterium]|nr:MAG: secretion protein HlyD [Rhodothalassiaceae bacterium]
MNRRPVVLIIALAVLVAGGGYLAWRAGAEGEAGARWYGYIEGEPVDVAAAEAGFLSRLAVRRGERVRAGAPLFAIDGARLEAVLAARRAALTQARAELADLKKGERPEELIVRRARLAEARARLEDAKTRLDRVRPLVASGALPRAELDAAEAAAAAAEAAVAAREAEIRVAELPARADRIAAAEALVAAREAELREIEERLADLAPAAPEDALVEDSFFLPGDWVPANAVVVRLLPDANRFARFWVGEQEVAALKPGDQVLVHCDGCGAPVAMRISFIAREAEFTPPVIYTRHTRQRFVFRVEARPPAPQARLPVGLPIEVTRP